MSRKKMIYSRIFLLVALLVGSESFSLIHNKYKYISFRSCINNFENKCLNSAISEMSISSRRTILYMAEEEKNDLLDKAKRLRQEAEELESNLRSKKGGSKNIKEEIGTTSKKVYNDLKNSEWQLSYRFASDAINRDKEDDSSSSKPVIYSGKVKIQLSEDGYTNVIPEGDSSSEGKLKFVKFWGWDEEISREDDEKYLLLSADVMLPSSDPIFSKKPIRFYFQTRIEKDRRSGEIFLDDGTVTLKKDIEPPGGFWGVFNGGGILAQFRYCGEFIMKPM